MFEKIIKNLEEKLRIKRDDLVLGEHNIHATRTDMLNTQAEITELEMAIKKLKE